MLPQHTPMNERLSTLLIVLLLLEVLEIPRKIKEHIKG